MNTTDLQFFKELLLNQRSEILNKTDAFRSEAAIEVAIQGDEGDLAVSENTLAMTLRLQERQTQHLQKIDYALGKIEDGSFGLCEQCEEPLQKNRLIARPVANLCIACKEEQESRERVHA
jgi:DnaK suppressor protein